MELYAHQKKIVDEAPDKWGLWLRMRVGKTPTTIRLITSRCKSGLIVCPKSLVSHWEKEIKLWSDDPEVTFRVISRDQFKKFFEIKKIKRGNKYIQKVVSCSLEKYDAIGVDEVHRGFGNYKTTMAKVMQFYLESYDIKFLWLLTGTPFTATSWSIFSYGKLLGRDWKWSDWNKTFFHRVRMGRRYIPVAKTCCDAVLQKILKRIGTVIDLKDVAEVADDVDIIETFDLSAEQKRHIKNINVDLPIVRYGQIHQLESGTRKSDGYNEELLFQCEKDKRLSELIDDNKKIVIVSRYLLQIKKYEQLAQKKNRRFYTIRGGQKETASEIADSVNSCEDGIVIIQSDTCDGYDLKSFDVMVFTSMSYSFVNYDQIKHRMKSMQKKTPNTYIHFITNGESLDRAVYDSVQKKQTFSIELYAKGRK